MSVLHGRERLMYTPRPGWALVSSGYAAVLGLVLLGVGLAEEPVVAAFGLLPLGLAVWFFYQARWTRAHPEVQERVLRAADQRLTSHPARYAALSGFLAGGLGAYELWRYTLGDRGDHRPPPVWAWPLVVLVGLAIGLLVARLRLKKARKRQSGIEPYQVENRFREAADNPGSGRS
jgi:hypothetical protein